MKLLDFQQRKLASRGKDLNKILLVVFVVLMVALIVLSLVFAEARALLILLAALACVAAIWAALRMRKRGGAVKC